MPVTDAYMTRTIGKLLSSRSVTHRKMFGGVGIYCEGVFFAVIDDDRLYFKVDDQNLPEYEAAGAEPWVLAGRGPQEMPYRELPAAVLEDTAKLGEWIDASVEVARRKKAKGGRK